jgi:two-component system, OmpR family, phosphate regulon sensor histidine kinase PhoR
MMTGQEENQNRHYETELISVVAHDLKIPVSAAKGFVELLSHLGPLNDQQRYYAQRTMDALLRMQGLINDLLGFAQLEAGVELKPHPVDLRVIVDRALEFLVETAAAQKITVEVDFSVDEFMVAGDARWLGHAVENLISNAIKYNREGGEVYITARLRHEGAQVDIIDTGQGIDVQDLPHIFDRFYRARQDGDTRVSGSGLGLAIVRMIIELHDGRIWVESERGQGSKFSFTLPLAVQQNGTGSASTLTAVPDSGSPSEMSDGVDDATQEPSEDFDTDSPTNEEV